MDLASPSKALQAAASARMTRQAHWAQSPSRNSVISFSPSPAKQIHRAWERRPVQGTSRNGKQRKIWKRFGKQENPEPQVPGEGESAELRSPAKVVKKVCIGKETPRSLRIGKRRGLVASWDRRKSGLPHKLPQSVDEELEAAPEDEQDLSKAATIAEVTHLVEVQDALVTNTIGGNVVSSEYAGPDLARAPGYHDLESSTEPSGGTNGDASGPEADNVSQTPGPLFIPKRQHSDIEDSVSVSVENVEVAHDAANPETITYGPKVETAAEVEEDVDDVDGSNDLSPPMKNIDEPLSEEMPSVPIENLNSDNSFLEGVDCVLSPSLQKASAQGDANVFYNHQEDEYDISGTEEDSVLDNMEALQDQPVQPRRRTAKGDTLIDIQIMSMPSSEDVEESIGGTTNSEEDQEFYDLEEQDESIEDRDDGAIGMVDVSVDSKNNTFLSDKAEAMDVDTTLDIDLSQSTKTLDQSQPVSLQETFDQSPLLGTAQVQSAVLEHELDDTLDILVDLPHPLNRSTIPRQTSDKLLDEANREDSENPALKSPAKCSFVHEKNCEDVSSFPIKEVTTTVKVNLNDDDTILRDFLSRSRANKAAKIAKQSSESNKRDSDVIKHALASPVRVLEEKDTNSPVSFKGREEQSVNSTLPTPKIGSPFKTDPGDCDFELHDELVNSLPVSIGRRTRSQPRRASKETSKHPHIITMRRSENVELLPLNRTETQMLGAVTRANTKKNKGSAITPDVRLYVMKHGMLLDFTLVPFGEKHSAETSKKVRWNEELVNYFNEEGRASSHEAQAESTGDEDHQATVAPKSRVRRAGTLGAVNGTPSKPKNAVEMPELAQAVAHQGPGLRDISPSTRFLRSHKGRIPTMKKMKPKDDGEKENKPNPSVLASKIPTCGTNSIIATGSRQTAMPRRGINTRR